MSGIEVQSQACNATSDTGLMIIELRKYNQPQNTYRIKSAGHQDRRYNGAWKGGSL